MTERADSPRTEPLPDIAVEVVQLNKWYGEFHVLRDINLKVARGERIVICGPSGGGKSTLLRCINRLEGWQQGRIIVDGNELTEDPKQIVAVRRDVGMVFQHFNLFPHLTVLENCTLAPMWVRHMPKKESEELAMSFLARVKIPDQANKYPARLSGGQQQRVAIARALVNDPVLVLADEPTGNLDPDLSLEVMNLLREVNAGGTTVLIATHDRELIRLVGRRTITLDQGRIAEVA